MDTGSKNRRRHPRLFRNVRFLFYFLGNTREVYTVDISYNGGFVQTDVFPPLGSFIILEHYHLKKRNVTLGLVGKIRRIQTPFQSSPSVRGVGVEWVRCYCNQGFLPLKQFLERDLGYQPFDWDTHLTYEDYDRKVVYDFATSTLSPTPQELETIFGARLRQRRAAGEFATPVSSAAMGHAAPEEASRRPTRQVIASATEITPPSGVRPGFAEDSAVRAAPGATPAPDADESPFGTVDPMAKTVPPVGAAPRPPAPSTVPPGAATTAPDDASADESTPPPGVAVPPPADGVVSDLLPVDIKVVFGIGNRMFYGVVHGISDHELAIDASAPQVLKPNARIQVRVPLSAKNYRYMVVIYGRVADLVERPDGTQSFRLRIESLDEFQNPGGFRFFLQTLTR